MLKFLYKLEIILDDSAISDKVAAVRFTGDSNCHSVCFEGISPARKTIGEKNRRTTQKHLHSNYGTSHDRLL